MSTIPTEALETTQSAIGIIGGADGPTAIFITGPDWSSAAITAVVILLVIAGIILLKKLKR